MIIVIVVPLSMVYGSQVIQDWIFVYKQSLTDNTQRCWIRCSRSTHGACCRPRDCVSRWLAGDDFLVMTWNDSSSIRGTYRSNHDRPLHICKWLGWTHHETHHTLMLHSWKAQNTSNLVCFQEDKVIYWTKGTRWEIGAIYSLLTRVTCAQLQERISAMVRGWGIQEIHNLDLPPQLGCQWQMKVYRTYIYICILYIYIYIGILEPKNVMILVVTIASWGLDTNHNLQMAHGKKVS